MTVDLTSLSMAEIWKLYAEYYGRLRLLHPYRQLLLTAISEMNSHINLKPTSTIFDAAGGDGGLLWALQSDPALPKPRVLLIDQSPDMIARAQCEPYDGHVDCRVADIDQPHTTWFIPEPVDAVHCGHAVYASNDPCALIRRFAAVTKPNGVLVFTNPLPEPNMMAVLKEHLAVVAAAGLDVGAELAMLQTELAPLVAINDEILRHSGQLHMSDEATTLAWLDPRYWQLQNHYRTYAGNDLMVVATRTEKSV